MIIFSGGLWCKGNNAGQGTIKTLIKNTKLAIKGPPQLIETQLSNIVVGSRAKSLKYHSLIKFNYKEYTGFLAGSLFEKNSQAHSKIVTSLNPYMIKNIIETRGKFLGKNYWGQYLLLIQDIHAEKVFIFPDPMGYSSLFYTKIEAGFIFSSDIWCLTDTLEHRASLDEVFLRSQITSSMGGLWSSERTPFIGISEIPHGYGLIASGNNFEIIQFWDPFRIAEEREFSRDDILPVFHEVINAWSLKPNDICVSLSGGLDSSALLMSAKHINKDNKKLLALTFGNPLVSSSDESTEAKKVADFCKVELKIYPWTVPMCLDKNDNKYERLDKPHVSLLSKHFWSDIEDIMLQCGDFVIWSGHGGDQMCVEGLNKASLADYWIDNKFNGIIDNLSSICQLHRVSIPYIIKNTLMSLYNYYFRKVKDTEYFKLHSPNWFLWDDRDADYLKTVFSPPFIAKEKKFKPAKFQHIMDIYEGPYQSKMSEKLRHVPVIYPYYSQPLVELFLSMPVYESYNEFYTRAPFREEVSKFFKTDLVFRKSKGETSGVLQLGIQQNIKRVYELCLEGYFSKHKMIDKQVLEDCIKKVQFGKTEELHCIINLISVELWLDNWSVWK